MSSFSHEIRNPLNSILGSIYLFKNSEFSEQQKQILERAECSGEILLA